MKGCSYVSCMGKAIRWLIWEETKTGLGKLFLRINKPDVEIRFKRLVVYFYGQSQNQFSSTFYLDLF